MNCARSIILVVAFLLCGREAMAAGDRMNGNLNLLLGAKALERDDWEPVEEQGEVGFEFDFRGKEWPVSIAMDYLAASSKESLDGVNYESRTSEFNIGVRKIWDGLARTRPFIGGGLSFANATAEASIPGFSLRASGGGTGFWVGGGVYWTLGESFNLGLEAKASSAKVKFSGTELDAGGGHFGLLLGYHWGGSDKPRVEAFPAGRPGYQQAAPVPAPSLQAAPAAGEKESLELEKEKLELEKQKLLLEREKFEFERRKAMGANN